MIRILIAVLVMSLVFSAGAPAQQAQVLDRVVANVNGQPLLLSDWEQALRYEAFLQGRPPESFTAGERTKALERLIDRELLRQQMQADYSAQPEELEQRIQNVRAQLKGANTEQGWRSILARYGLTEDEFRDSVRTEMRVLRFVDLRLRPVVRVDRDAIAAYYRETLVPRLRVAGVEPEPLEEVAPKIRELLVEEKMQSVLDDWLSNLRSQSSVHMTQQAGPNEPQVTPGGGSDSPIEIVK